MVLCHWSDNALSKAIDYLIETPVPDIETTGFLVRKSKKLPKQHRILLLPLVAPWNLKYYSLAKDTICIGPGPWRNQTEMSLDSS